MSRERVVTVFKLDGNPLMYDEVSLTDNLPYLKG